MTWALCTCRAAEPATRPSLEALRLPDLATRVTVRPAVGEPLQIQLVDAASITNANVSFSIAGYAGGSLELSDGMSYPGSWHRASNCVAPIVPEVYAGTNLLSTSSRWRRSSRHSQVTPVRARGVFLGRSA